jgi:hypothetical protein
MFKVLTFHDRLKVGMTVVWEKLTTTYRAAGVHVAGFRGLTGVRRLTGGRQFASVGLHGYCKFTVK